MAFMCGGRSAMSSFRIQRPCLSGRKIGSEVEGYHYIYTGEATIQSIKPPSSFSSPRLGRERPMASSMMVSSAATMSRTTPAQSSMVAPFIGLKSTSAFPATRRANTNLTNLPSNGGKVQCMKVWPIEGLKKFETLSYLPTLPVEALLKQIEYLIRNNWIPCLEFSKDGFVSRIYHSSPGYYDGRYWTMWKLPMFGCTDAAQVVKEVQECSKEYPDAYIRVIGFDNKRQVQCISFIAHKPE